MMNLLQQKGSNERLVIKSPLPGSVPTGFTALDDISIAEIILAKQKNRHVGTVKLAFNKSCVRFESFG